MKRTHGFGRGRGPREHPGEEVRAAQRAGPVTGPLPASGPPGPRPPAPVDLNAALADMIRSIRRLVGSSIEVVWIPGRDLPPVPADPSQVGQVVMNLVANARDAMPRGGRLTLETYRVVVDASCARGQLQSKPGPHAVLAVTDTGVGIEESIRDRIFEPFSTTRAERRGTGLGLATVYAIVQQHGGDIFVYSERGVGTTFKIYLPVHEGAAEAAMPEAAALPPDPRTILLVEDDASVRPLVEMVLRDAGHAVLSAGSGEEALRVLAGHPGAVDLLFSDVGLPGMDGVALAERVRRMRPGIRVLLSSGYTETTAAGGGRIPDGADFLAKPFGPSALLDKLLEMFGPGMPPAPPAGDSPCAHLRLERQGILRGSEDGERVYLLACLACGATVSTEGLREERRARAGGRVP